jgi:hypothetical protein
VAGIGTNCAFVANVISNTFKHDPETPPAVMVQSSPLMAASTTRPLPLPAPVMLISGAVNVAVRVMGPVTVQGALTHDVSVTVIFEPPNGWRKNRSGTPNGYVVVHPLLPTPRVTVQRRGRMEFTRSLTLPDPFPDVTIVIGNRAGSNCTVTRRSWCITTVHVPEVDAQSPAKEGVVPSLGVAVS